MDFNVIIISIHTPRVGRDITNLNARTIDILFQSTRPVWGVTVQVCTDPGRDHISIHTPRVGRDNSMRPLNKAITISIHTPRVGRDHPLSAQLVNRNISIHTPRVGRDPENTCSAL